MALIELFDERAAALKARAAEDGLSLEAWLDKLAEAEPASQTPLQTAADMILNHIRKVPAELMATMPEDGASEHDHYIYGWPRRDPSNSPVVLIGI